MFLLSRWGEGRDEFLATLSKHKKKVKGERKSNLHRREPNRVMEGGWVSNARHDTNYLLSHKA